MKADIINGKPIIDTEAIKAIRFCCGYTSDLRVKLTNDIYHKTIEQFLNENGYRVFGISFWEYSVKSREAYASDTELLEQIDKNLAFMRKAVSIIAGYPVRCL